MDIECFKTAFIRAESGDPRVLEGGELPTASIDVDGWGARIQVHGEDQADAAALRDFVLQALLAYQKS